MRVTRDLLPAIDEMPSRLRSSYTEIKDETFWAFYERAKDYSMVHIAGFYNVYQSLNYIKRNQVLGCLVECGCFLGGIAAFMGLMRQHLDMRGAEIFLFDTFEGPPVGSEDGGHVVTSSLPDYESIVKENIVSVVGSTDGYCFIRGPVETTAPLCNLAPISLLRMDTDYYSSTKIELEVFYPQLSGGGVLIVDDYGYVESCRKATDEYIATLPNPPLLNRIDFSVWAGVKPASTS